MFLQKLWSHQLDWDEPLPADLREQWIALRQELSIVRNTCVIRPYFNSMPSDASYELHVFCDASAKAYGGVVYLRQIHTNTVSLVISKARVTPVKQLLTIPRAELMGALLGTRLINFAYNSLKGPMQTEEPREKVDNKATCLLGQATRLGLAEIIDPNRHSSMGKLLRVTAFVLRFTHNIRTDRNKRTTGVLTAQEISKAELSWIKDIQSLTYESEIIALRKKEKSLGQLSRQLRLFIDADEILRVGGRLHNAPLDYRSKFPILLPPKTRFTELLVMDAHSMVKHSGQQATMTQLRHRFWITQLRQYAKSLLRTCVMCKRVNGKPYKKPIPAPLQAMRLHEAPSFTVTGCDFTGECYVTLAGKEHKSYICLFTCAVTRAVHLELVLDLSTETFLRFAARRSLPSKMLSDNGSTYLSAADQLHKLMKAPQVQAYLAGHRVEWKFIPKRAPWFGGFWERLIGVTKMTLKKVLGRAFVSADELQTVLAEIEAVINDRPLTYVSSDSNDLPPLTPSHLLNGRPITVLPYYTMDIDELQDPSFDQDTLQKRSQRLAKIHCSFWKRWSQEYLAVLREKDNLSGKGALVNRIRTGDIVMVNNDQLPRLKWQA
ncbi:uncharacterized protein LOC135491050 [Lineus longissimus]|uniref:uncharacterized protein LOC135491050 n=1 Tax=Lineus longissimus TaxID=88925 RepID=UPI00315DC01E